MKKSLLALSLTAFAASSFAATLHSNDTSKVDLGAQGLTYVQVAKDDKTATTYYNRLRLFNKASYKVEDLTVGYFVRYQNFYIYEKTKETKVENGKSVTSTKKEHTKKGFGLHCLYLTASYKGFGSITYGKTGTAYGSAGSDTNVVDTDMAVYGDSAYNNSFVYKSEAYDFGKFAVSYARSNPAKYKKVAEYAVSYDKSLGEVNLGVQAVVKNHYTKATDGNYGKVSQRDVAGLVSAEYSAKVADLDTTFTGVLSYANVNKLKTSKTNKFGVGLKASATVNEYFQPYVGVSYLTSSTTATKDKKKTTEKTTAGYLGFGADLYKYQALSVYGFVEGSVVKKSSAEKQFATGLSVSF